MDTTLTDRYVDAATRSLPDSQRADVAAELRASIADQVDARIEQGMDAAAAERAVLTDLGDPDKLAAGYADRPLWLIGPRYFLEWKRLVALLLWIVPVSAAFGLSLAMVLDGAGFLEIVGAVFPLVLTVAVHVVFWTTLVFAVVERTRGRATGAPLAPWSLDHLPHPRQKGAGLAEVIGGFVAVVAAVAALAWDHFVGWVPGIQISFFDEGLWPVGAAYAAVILILDALLLLVVYLVRRWTIPLAIASTVLNLAITVPALWLLFQGRLLNAAFFPTVLPEGGEEVAQIMMAITGFGIVAIAIVEIVDTFRKALAGRR